MRIRAFLHRPRRTPGGDVPRGRCPRASSAEARPVPWRGRTVAPGRASRHLGVRLHLRPPARPSSRPAPGPGPGWPFPRGGCVSRVPAAGCPAEHWPGPTQVLSVPRSPARQPLTLERRTDPPGPSGVTLVAASPGPGFLPLCQYWSKAAIFHRGAARTFKTRGTRPCGRSTDLCPPRLSGKTMTTADMIALRCE